MSKGLLGRIGAGAAGLVLALSVSACGSGGTEEVVEDSELEQSEEVGSQSGAMSGEEVIPLEGPFEVIDPEDPENLQIKNACIQLQNNTEEAEAYLNSLDQQMAYIDPDTPEGIELQDEYVAMFSKISVNIGNEELAEAWKAHSENLKQLLADVDAGNEEAAEESYAVFNGSAEDVMNLCSPFFNENGEIDIEEVEE